MRRRILVVDDEPGVLRAVCRILQESYDVEGVPSAEQALALFGEYRPDLAVLDIRMPGMDGFTLMQELKSSRPDLDVILMTGSADESDEKLLRAIRERAFYFIQKPFDREVLLAYGLAIRIKLRKPWRLTGGNIQYLYRHIQSET